MPVNIIMEVTIAFAARAFDDAIPGANLKATPWTVTPLDRRIVFDLKDRLPAIRHPDPLQP
jgi:hypothetical protein